MFQGTFKDILTNIFAFVAGAIGLFQAIYLVYQQWLTTASPKPTLTEWITLLVLIVSAITAWFTGKDSQGKPKVDV